MANVEKIYGGPKDTPALLHTIPVDFVLADEGSGEEDLSMRPARPHLPGITKLSQNFGPCKGSPSSAKILALAEDHGRWPNFWPCEGSPTLAKILALATDHET